MNRLKRAVTTLVAVVNISLGAAIIPAITAVTSEGHSGLPDVFHCC
jgi:hypothetical protein